MLFTVNLFHFSSQFKINIVYAVDYIEYMNIDYKKNIYFLCELIKNTNFTLIRNNPWL